MGPTLLGCISPFHQTQESPECPVGFPWDISVLTQWLLGGLCFSCLLVVSCTNSLCSAHQPKVLFYPTAFSGTAVPGKGGLWLGGDISHGLSLCCLNLPGWAGSIVGRFLLLWNVSLWWRGQLFSLNTNSGFLCLVDFFFCLIGSLTSKLLHNEEGWSFSLLCLHSVRARFNVCSHRLYSQGQ